MMFLKEFFYFKKFCQNCFSSIASKLGVAFHSLSSQTYPDLMPEVPLLGGRKQSSPWSLTEDCMG